MSGADVESSAARPRRSDIDGLRAIAVLAILLFHAAPVLGPGGFVGVDIFFVISGYLITRIIEVERQAGAFSFAGFYQRRARRILPAYVVVTALVAAAAYLFLMPRELKNFGWSLAASGLFLTNLVFAKSGGYFEATADQAPLLHLWSLAVEEQFYLVWPLVLAGLSLSAVRKARVAAVLLLAAGSLAAAQFMLATGETRAAFFLLPFRAWEFLLGGALALGAAAPPRSARWAECGVAAGLLLIAGSVWGLSRGAPFPGVAALPACFGAALIIWGGGAGETRLGAVLRAPPVVGIGLISYSLYLWHWPLLVFGRVYLGRPLEPVEGLAIAAASVPLAWLTWRFVEQPWRRSGAGLGWRHLTTAVLAMGAIVSLGAVAKQTQGLPQRLPPSVRAAAEFEEKDVNPQREICLEGASDGRITPESCRPRAPVQVIVWGDSHADALYPGVAVWAERRGYAIQQSTMGGCPPLPGVRAILVPGREHVDCAPFNTSVLQDIARAPELKLIVLIARWPLYGDVQPSYDINSPRVEIEDASAKRGVRIPLEEALDRTLTAIARTGTKARVLIVGPVPELTFNPPLCIAQRRLLKQGEQSCWTADSGLPLSRAWIAEAQIARVLIRHMAVATVNPTSTLCAQGRCRVAAEGRLLYFDDDHLSATGARALVPGWLEAALKE